MALNAGILKHPGIRHKIKGYNIEERKLIKVSLIKIIWVFLYTAQKHDIKYQKKSINKKLNIKNIINFIFKQFSIYLAFFFALLILDALSVFNFKILLSDKDKFLNNILAIDEIIEE